MTPQDIIRRERALAGQLKESVEHAERTLMQLREKHRKQCLHALQLEAALLKQETAP
jgi:hypothetical protein